MAVISNLITRSDNIKLTLHVYRYVSINKISYYKSIWASAGIGKPLENSECTMHIWNPRAVDVGTGHSLEFTG